MTFCRKKKKVIIKYMHSSCQVYVEMYEYIQKAIVYTYLVEVGTKRIFRILINDNSDPFRMDIQNFNLIRSITF